MKCLEAQRLIQPYLEHKLSDRDMRQFLDHVEHCPDCYEELELTLAVMSAVAPEQDRKNAGEYDFERQLKNEINRSRRYLRIERTHLLVRHTLIGVAEIILVLTVITGIELQRPAGRYGTTLYRIIHRGETEPPMDTGFEQVTEDLSELLTITDLPAETLTEAFTELAAETDPETSEETSEEPEETEETKKKQPK